MYHVIKKLGNYCRFMKKKVYINMYILRFDNGCFLLKHLFHKLYKFMCKFGFELKKVAQVIL